MASRWNGDAAKTYRWSYDDVDTKTYAKSDAGERVTNRFEDADANYWKDGAVTYLTRSRLERHLPDRTGQDDRYRQDDRTA